MNLIREKLAEFAHNQWSVWMKHFLKKCEIKEDGTAIIPKWFIDKIIIQMKTEYKDLSEIDKDLDRNEADGMIQVFKKQELR